MPGLSATAAPGPSPDGKPDPGAGRKRLLGYCTVLGALPFLLIAFAFFAAPTEWAIRHSGNPYLANVGYAASLKNADCQVVIYGDSSAMVGLDPAVVEARTGLKTCNIAEFAGMTVVNGFDLPDLYLRNNPRPRIWLFDFAPENLARHATWEGGGVYEAILFRLREKPDLSTFELLVEHPKQAIEFATLGLRQMMIGLMRSAFPESVTQLRAEHRGWMPIFAPELTECANSKAWRRHLPDPEFVRALRARYGADGTAVIVDATPQPDCDPTFEYYAVQHPAPTDNHLETYPVTDFNVSGRQHMNQVGTVRFSNAVGDQITTVLRRQGSAPQETR